MFMSLHQNAGKRHNMKIVNKSLKIQRISNIRERLKNQITPMKG